jgi:hypothetical protein
MHVFYPMQLLLVLGSKMEHIITELALEVIQKHTAIEGVLVVTPSDELFWFHRPKLVLLLIHIILFQNAFEIAFFFWLLVRTIISHLHFHLTNIDPLISSKTIHCCIMDCVVMSKYVIAIHHDKIKLIPKYV